MITPTNRQATPTVLTRRAALLAMAELAAVLVAACGPTPTAVPIATATAAPSATPQPPATATATATAAPSATPQPTAMPEPTATVILPTATPPPTGTPVPPSATKVPATATVQPSPTQTLTNIVTDGELKKANSYQVVFPTYLSNLVEGKVSHFDKLGVAYLPVKYGKEFLSPLDGVVSNTKTMDLYWGKSLLVTVYGGNGVGSFIMVNSDGGKLRDGLGVGSKVVRGEVLGYVGKPIINDPVVSLDFTVIACNDSASCEAKPSNIVRSLTDNASLWVGNRVGVYLR